MDIPQVIGSYRISTSGQEILQLMLKSYENQRPILWQTYDSHRVVHDITAFDLNLQKRQIKVSHGASQELLDPSRPAYVKLPFRESVFKGEILSAQPGTISLKIPTEVHWREFREQERVQFKLNEHFITLKPHVPHLLPELLPTMKLAIKDITMNGFGMFTSGDNDQFFKEQKFLDVTALDNINLSRSHSAYIVWRQRVQTKAELAQGLVWRLGVRMINPFTHASLDALTGGGVKRQRIARELINTSLGEDFQKLLESAVQNSMTKMRQKPAISKYLRQLEVSRSESDYLMEHIEVLIVVCIFLSRALNWVSEASLEKFIYAAYLHDAALFQRPRLAQLSNRDDLEKHRDQLTHAEVDIFKYAPQEAARIAREDSSAPPDVEQMLLMQKEMPDGSGFPRALRAHQIPALPSLFIVAHALTEEIMSNTRWNIEEWVKKHKAVFKGGHFDKVMDALYEARISFR
ncbi:MAG: hypothetical protein LW878_08505 [Proteobacteria bacterium]|nr:hypothetical protein [Pseudomonadota bacterium]